MPYLPEPIEMSQYELWAWLKTKTRHHEYWMRRVCENGWLVFILLDAWELRWRASPLSESVRMAPLRAATHDRGLGREKHWRDRMWLYNQFKLPCVSCISLYFFLYCWMHTQDWKCTHESSHDSGDKANVYLQLLQQIFEPLSDYFITSA